MPRAISKDGGRSYEVSRTPFPRQGSNQRPTVIRLQSGRLFFAADFSHLNDGSQPKGINNLGSYVALSSDEGETWQIRKLPGAQLHETPRVAETMRGPTLGYSVSRQGPNGMIHLVATMNNPCLHFEFNEAWILGGDTAERPDAELMASRAKSVNGVRNFVEKHPDGKPRITWGGGMGDDGRFLLHGIETWYYENGNKQREVAYRMGRKTGVESYWAPSGDLLWSWEHRENGTSTWRQFRRGGALKSESSWKNFKADGTARLWNASGKLISEKSFQSGNMR